jgi:hypothetical protein
VECPFIKKRYTNLCFVVVMNSRNKLELFFFLLSLGFLKISNIKANRFNFSSNFSARIDYNCQFFTAKIQVFHDSWVKICFQNLDIGIVLEKP